MKTTVIGTKILVAVPFEKKDEFKKVMNGNARWDSAAKTWYVEKTAENEALLGNFIKNELKDYIEAQEETNWMYFDSSYFFHLKKQNK